jgi:hypothetical protein
MRLKMTKLKPCFKCGVQLSNIDMGQKKNEITFIPSNGVFFHTTGNYGSRFWDSLEGNNIGIVVCDDCLKNNQDLITYYNVSETRKVKISYIDPRKRFW